MEGEYFFSTTQSMEFICFRPGLEGVGGGVGSERSHRKSVSLLPERQLVRRDVSVHVHVHVRHVRPHRVGFQLTEQVVFL
jgi:hypothetical protein